MIHIKKDGVITREMEREFNIIIMAMNIMETGKMVKED